MEILRIYYTPKEKFDPFADSRFPHFPKRTDFFTRYFLVRRSAIIPVKEYDKQAVVYLMK
jgi:hypothetical protein